MHVCAQTASPRFAAARALPSSQHAWAPAEAPLHLKVLRTPEQREALANLRKHAAMGLEEDLRAGLMPFEALRDQIGLVTALYRGQQAVATLRLVPSGHGLTAAERVWDGVGARPGILGPGNWEVGRLVVAPEERSPELLRRCLAMALQALTERREVEHFYAVSAPPLARLWRRFGMDATATLYGASGRKIILVSGHVAQVARALHLPPRGGSPVTVVDSHHAQRESLAA